jgi:hypothetical protein
LGRGRRDCASHIATAAPSCARRSSVAAAIGATPRPSEPSPDSTAGKNSQDAKTLALGLLRIALDHIQSSYGVAATTASFSREPYGGGSKTANPIRKLHLRIPELVTAWRRTLASWIGRAKRMAVVAAAAWSLLGIPATMDVLAAAATTAAPGGIPSPTPVARLVAKRVPPPEVWDLCGDAWSYELSRIASESAPNSSLMKQGRRSGSSFGPHEG